MFSIPALLFCLAAYMLGSIPITKIAGKGDIREIGSGNIGTTNVCARARASPLQR